MPKQMTLGQLIDVLERKDQAARVAYSFGYFHPTSFGSWRGAYEELSIGYEHASEISARGGEHPTVASLLARAIVADGATYHGYKGGEYTMDRDQRVWISKSNEACHSGLADVRECEGEIILVSDMFSYPF